MNKKTINNKNELFSQILFDMKLASIHIEHRIISLITIAAYIVFFAVTSIILGYTGYAFINDRDKLVIIVHHFVLVFSPMITVVYLHMKKDDVHFLVVHVKRTYNYNCSFMLSYMKTQLQKRKTLMKIYHYCIILLPFYVLFNDTLYSVIEKYLWGSDYVLLFPIYTELDMENWFFYSLILVWEMSVIFFVIVIISGAMGSFLLIHSHLSIEFDILKYAILNINKIIESRLETSTTAKVSDDMRKYVKERIQKNCIDEIARHFDNIIMYFNKTRGCLDFGYTLLVACGILITVCTGVMLLSENQPVKLKFYGIFVAQLAYLYAACWIGESIASKSDCIGLALYEIEWWNFPESCHTSILVMLERLMKPFYYYTFLGQKIQLESFMDMVKGSYSYFNMIFQSQ